VSDDWRDGRWHPDYPDAECFYHGVVCWRDGHEERLATEDIPYELNRLDVRVAELEAENARLRAAALPIAQLVEDAERDEAELIEDESTPNGLWASLVGVMDESDHYHEIIAALGTFRDAFLGEKTRCEKCGSALIGDYYEEEADGSRKWWRGCYHCGPKGCPDVTEEYE
jgi:hypothetical protein